MGVTQLWESHENPRIREDVTLYNRWLDILVFRWPCIAFPI